MTKKFRCKCLYCGIEWTDEESYGWKQRARKCTHCGETKNIAAKAYTETTGDVLGTGSALRFRRTLTDQTTTTSILSTLGTGIK